MADGCRCSKASPVTALVPARGSGRGSRDGSAHSDMASWPAAVSRDPRPELTEDRGIPRIPLRLSFLRGPRCRCPQRGGDGGNRGMARGNCGVTRSHHSRPCMNGLAAWLAPTMAGRALNGSLCARWDLADPLRRLLELHLL